MPWQVDPRQMSLFGGGWTAISFKYLAESGIDTVTYYESTGERGSMMGNRSSRWPGQFVAAKGVFFPLFHVLAFILYHKKTRIMKSISSNPLKVDGLFFYDKESTGIVLVNFSHLQETVRIPHIKKTAKILSLDEHTFDEAGSNNDWLIQAEWEKHNVSDKGLKLTLNPYASLFIRI